MENATLILSEDAMSCGPPHADHRSDSIDVNIKDIANAIDGCDEHENVIRLIYRFTNGGLSDERCKEAWNLLMEYDHRQASLSAMMMFARLSAPDDRYNALIKSLLSRAADTGVSISYHSDNDVE